MANEEHGKDEEAPKPSLQAPLLHKFNIDSINSSGAEFQEDEEEGDEPEPELTQEALEFDSEAQKERGKTLGEKDLGLWLSVIFIVNQIYGPGVLAIPIVFQQTGVFPTLLALCFFLFVSCFASTFLCAAIACIPDNQNFERRIEYSTAVEFYYGNRFKLLMDVFINITLQSYNLASIIVCAQSLDQFLIFMFGKTFALELSPHFTFASFQDVNVLYSSQFITLSLGYVLIMLMCIPMSMTNLDDNVKVVQTASFLFLFVLLLEFVGYFFWKGAHSGYHGLPFIGHSASQLISVFIFSWAYVMFIPSWVNEKANDVSVNRAVWISGIFSFFGYLMIGLLCASVSDRLALDNMLVRLSLSPTPVVTIVCAYLFSLGVIAPGIPVCSITTRYNLYVGRICGKKQSYFWGVFAPWIIGFIFSQGEIFAQLLNWSSLIFNGIVNFLVPIHMYYLAITRYYHSHHRRPSSTSIDYGTSGEKPPRKDSDVLSHQHVNVHELDDTIRPFPSWLNLSLKHERRIVLAMFWLTAASILWQICMDLYYLIFKHKNILDND